MSKASLNVTTLIATDMYAGAYRRNAIRLRSSLEKPSLASGLADHLRHARAFESMGTAASNYLGAFVKQIGWNHVLDIGCGPATLLVNPEKLGRKSKPPQKRAQSKNLPSQVSNRLIQYDAA